MNSILHSDFNKTKFTGEVFIPENLKSKIGKSVTKSKILFLSRKMFNLAQKYDFEQMSKVHNQIGALLKFQERNR